MMRDELFHRRSPSFDLGGAMKTPPDSNVGVIIYIYDRARLGGRGSGKKAPERSSSFSSLVRHNNAKQWTGIRETKTENEVGQTVRKLLPPRWQMDVDARLSGLCSIFESKR